MELSKALQFSLEMSEFNLPILKLEDVLALLLQRRRQVAPGLGPAAQFLSQCADGEAPGAFLRFIQSCWSQIISPIPCEGILAER